MFRLQPRFAQLFLDSLCFYRRKLGLRFYAYVVMPDHYHLLVGFPPSVHVSHFLRDFKSYVGKQAVEQLKKERNYALLKRFRSLRARKRRRDPTYAVFQPDNDDRVIYSEKFFHQKLRYIHKNPVKKGLVGAAAEYPWSSCRNYLTGEPHPIYLDSWA